jgi:hypothetical protein
MLNIIQDVLLLYMYCVIFDVNYKVWNKISQYWMVISYNCWLLMLRCCGEPAPFRCWSYLTWLFSHWLKYKLQASSSPSIVLTKHHPSGYKHLNFPLNPHKHQLFTAHPHHIMCCMTKSNRKNTKARTCAFLFASIFTNLFLDIELQRSSHRQISSCISSAFPCQTPQLTNCPPSDIIILAKIQDQLLKNIRSIILIMPPPKRRTISWRHALDAWGKSKYG